jgi:phosphate transport system protein
MEQSDLGHHISRQFNEDLSALRHRALHMGGLVERQVEGAVRALFEGHLDLAEKVVRDDRQVDELEVQLDEESRRILALRQPAASDLRLVVGTMKMVTDLERTGDEAREVARCALRLASQEPEGSAFQRAWNLAGGVGLAVSGVLDAFARLDVPRALEVVRLRNQMDVDLQAVIDAATELMQEQPEQIPVYLDLLCAARSLHRIASHARNVSEQVVFMVSGIDVRHIGADELALALEPVRAGRGVRWPARRTPMPAIRS